VLHLVMLYVLQKSVVDREGAADAVDIEMGAIQAVVDMQLQGMYVSRAKWTEIADTALINKRQKYDELQYLLLPDSYKQLMGESARLCKVFDPNSSPDTIKAYKRIGVHLGAKDRQGKWQPRPTLLLRRSTDRPRSPVCHARLCRCAGADPSA